MKPRLHLFVCCNRRPAGGRPSCGQRDSRAVLAGLQRALAGRRDLWDAVRITETGCLGPCFDGPTVVAYPDNTWYGGVTADDADALLDHHLGNGPALDHRRLDEPDADSDAE